mmetsp:Transcript_8590/g.24690  ORF Transcript_8590/g.24690 Transcript_8590/m.24690 type:complete len:451 (-) Transcript_8590:158-1510(-)
MTVARLLGLAGLFVPCQQLASGRVLKLKSKSSMHVGRPMKEMMPWYHSADEIHDKLSQLANGGCHGADFDISQRSEVNSGAAAGQVVQLDVLHISRSSSGTGRPKTRAMMVYGEHARELISPESALHFVETLCGDGVSASRASAVLDNVSFTIVPVANPVSRKLVEEGQYCKRTNEDGVDLNRNFGDAHRVSSADEPGEEMNPGPSGFSEPESRIIRDLVQEEKPDIYLSIHSGAYLLGTPFGFTADQTPDNEASMMEVLKPISDKYCAGQCPYGNLARLIHYENPGCDIDYVRESAGTPYVFTWEIYAGEEYRSRYIEQARMQNGVGDDSPDDAMSLAAVNRTRLRAQARLRGAMVRPEDDIDVESCLNQFNPRSEGETQSVVERWTNAYLELCEEVARKADEPKPQQAAAATSATSVTSSSGDAQPESTASLEESWPSLAALSRPGSV